MLLSIVFTPMSSAWKCFQSSSSFLFCQLFSNWTPFQGVLWHVFLWKLTVTSFHWKINDTPRHPEDRESERGVGWLVTKEKIFSISHNKLVLFSPGYFKSSRPKHTHTDPVCVRVSILVFRSSGPIQFLRMTNESVVSFRNRQGDKQNSKVGIIWRKNVLNPQPPICQSSC